jgi:hypothetical protein
MVTRIFFFSALLVAAPAWPQATDASGASAGDASSTQMPMPPPVSAVGFPTAGGAEQRANYLSGSVMVSGGYITNLYPGAGAASINDGVYQVQPTLTADHSTDRSHASFSYAPSFSFYDPSNSLDTVNQSGATAFQYRLSPHSNFLAGDTVTKTSDTWTQPLSSGSVSGGLPSVTPGIVVPFAPQVSNSAYAQVGWQFSLNDMVGAGGVTTLVSYSQSSGLATGLYNSVSHGGSGFYTHRVNDRQYIGATYQYSEVAAKPAAANGVAEADLDADNVLGFYTAYLRPALSLSLGGGAQHYRLTQGSAANLRGWAPSALASLGWQGLHTSFALNYSRVNTEGAGIIGVYSSNSAAVSGSWQPSRNWTMGLGGNYSALTTESRSSAGSISGGHTLSGSASVGRRLSEKFSLAVQYQRLHQNFPGVIAISSDPNSSRVSASITCHFSRPLGR